MELRGVQPTPNVGTLADLAAMTGTTTLGVLADAVRVYEWLLAQQDAGRTVAILEPADMAHLEATPELQGERAVLVPLRRAP